MQFFRFLFNNRKTIARVATLLYTKAGHIKTVIQTVAGLERTVKTFTNDFKDAGYDRELLEDLLQELYDVDPNSRQLIRDALQDEAKLQSLKAMILEPQKDPDFETQIVVAAEQYKRDRDLLIG